MTDTQTSAGPGAISDTLIEEAVGRLDMTARLEGPNATLFLDATVPPSAEETGGDLLFLMRAAAELHDEIEAGQDLSDVEESLKDALKGDDQAAIDEGLDLYRGLLASKLKAIWRGRSGAARLASLSEAKTRPW
jgi:hypothetical protein